MLRANLGLPYRPFLVLVGEDPPTQRMRWHDDGRAEVRGPGASDHETVAIVGFELAHLHPLQEALRAAVQRLGPAG